MLLLLTAANEKNMVSWWPAVTLFTLSFVKIHQCIHKFKYTLACVPAHPDWMGIVLGYIFFFFREDLK